MLDIEILLDGAYSLIIRNVNRYSFKTVLEKMYLYVETSDGKEAYFPIERVIGVGDLDIFL